ncbi:RDD family protein [Kistimonas asteriae]|uniref:RDD family protein n=1 Tax=Kistimonas asteriae TaxID=517724 RepID=UPI001BAA3030|nr:RDD family protein [Kistimonas asteriae]
MRQLLDTTCRVETPESIDLQAEVAGVVPRMLAFALDLLIRFIIFLIVLIAVSLAGRAGEGLFLVVLFLLEWFYPVVFEVYRGGQTPGKKALGLVVVNEDLTPVGLGASVIRNLLRSVDFMPFLYGTGLVSLLLTRRFQRLGDLAAGTLVVYRSEDKVQGELPEGRPLAPSIALSLDDQMAMMSFTRRHTSLSDARQQELADILLGVTHDNKEDSVTRLQGIGLWLSGKRQ